MRTRFCVQKRARGKPRPARDFRQSRTALGLALVLCGCASDGPARATVTLATTHTVEDTGLLDVLTQSFTTAHPEIRLRVIVVGSGEALALGRRGDADVLLTHAPEDEERFVEEGYARSRRPIVRNEFVLYGPAADPAHVRGTRDIAEAFRGVMAQRSPFISRADDSGTHKRERSIWAAVGATPQGEWYQEAGIGQADALRVASERQAYILADRATFAVLAASLDLVAISEGDPRLANIYSVLEIARPADPQAAAIVAEWLSSGSVAPLFHGLGTDAEGRPLFEPLPASSVPSAELTPPRHLTVRAPAHV